MKKIAFVICFVLAGLVSMAQDNVAKFKETKHNFGNVKYKKPASATFTFTNTSNKPLIIETATATCGCTTPEYPKKPILPGKTGDVKATFNAETMGHFDKSVTVKFANVEQPVVLIITGEVVK
ncbi:MAG: DUF1573 domain-containing protein [Pseudopedobacter saltans]|uniref:DUF1573 domain-containing protein n=1 Tax=Pseudopedobacter saltans TaxID=151895 RepID=A0A2W5H1L3_9SPHI|nr:MAG: DUF1573 domain-containing protein [Pseudopedobacter saltans]